MSAKEPKPKKPKKPKKNQIVENKGITGDGTDYTVYILDSKQKILAVVAGFLIGYIAGYIYFDNETVGLIVGLIAGYKAISIYRNKLFNDRKKELRLQFRDLLESLSNSFTVGRTAIGAFENAYSDMIAEHGTDAYITKEVYLICTAYQNGIEIKKLLNDFAERSGIDDIRSFAGVFEVSTDLGGNVAKTVRETRDMISDKIEIELEIQTMVTGQKNQLNVLAIMPLVMSLLTRSFSTDGGGGMLVIVVKILALGLFVFAYWMGTKIVDIKV